MEDWASLTGLTRAEILGKVSRLWMMQFGVDGSASASCFWLEYALRESSGYNV